MPAAAGHNRETKMNESLRSVMLCVSGFALSAAAQAQTPREPMAYENAAGGPRLLEEGQPPAMVHPTVEDAQSARESGTHRGAARAATSGGNLTYHGGVGGVGVETAPKVYLVFWGSQWNNGDPSGEATILERFYGGVGGNSWTNIVTQYCQGVASGTTFCNGAGSPAGNPSGVFAGYFYDNASAAPTHPKQSQIAAEAVRAAAHFGNTTASSNASVQYVIAPAHGSNSSGFGRSYCAYHSSTSSAYGNVAYTNLPYMTDAGASCGANFNGLGPDAGITIVGGHEMAETMTDQFPNGGWLDGNGSEIGDKCAWISSGQGASADITLSTGTFAVQSLWSNAFNGDSGGCVLSYP
jgi:serine protease